MSAHKLDVPKETLDDKEHAIAKGMIGMIPGLGSLAAEVFGIVLSPQIIHRRDEWMETVAVVLKEYEGRGVLHLDDLAKNGTFIDTVLQATQAAIRTQSELKRACLRNAVINATKPSAPDAASQHMYVSFIDRFTDWHILLLEFFHDPLKWAEAQGKSFPDFTIGAPAAILEIAYPELAKKREFYQQIWRELHASGLVTGDSLAVTNSAGGIVSSRTTTFGESFLKFVTQ